MTLEQKIEALERELNELRQCFIQSQKNLTNTVKKSDISFSKTEQVDINESGVFENDRAVCDVADMADMNSVAIDDIAVMVDDLEQRVEALEDK